MAINDAIWVWVSTGGDAMTASHGEQANGWVSMRHLQHIAARGRQAEGLDVAAVLEEAGLKPDHLANAEDRIPLPALEAMLAAFERRHDVAMLGLELASDIQPATFGILGHLAQACSTFGGVLDEVTRFNGLLSNIGETSVARAPGEVAICWTCGAGSPAFKREATEYVLGAMARLMRFLMPEQDEPIRKVTFAHARPDDPRLSRRYYRFFRAPVYFDQPIASIVVPASLLAIRMPHGDDRLKALLEAHANQQLQQHRNSETLGDEVRHVIGILMAEGTPTKEGVARQLGLSSRTLHRRLQAAGTSYRALLDTARLQRADDLLCREAASVATTAARLGFSSHQSFVRWFKQHAGATPANYRQAGSKP